MGRFLQVSGILKNQAIKKKDWKSEKGGRGTRMAGKRSAWDGKRGKNIVGSARVGKNSREESESEGDWWPAKNAVRTQGYKKSD